MNVPPKIYLKLYEIGRFHLALTRPTKVLAYISLKLYDLAHFHPSIARSTTCAKILCFVVIKSKTHKKKKTREIDNSSILAYNYNKLGGFP